MSEVPRIGAARASPTIASRRRPSWPRSAPSPRVYDLGHSRAGDKSNTSTVSVITYDEAGWRVLRRELTAERVMAAYAHIAKGPVTRYNLPKLRALNFVVERALGAGVTRSLRQDMHGKSLSTPILTIELPDTD
jgi:hypothetical protein